MQEVDDGKTKFTSFHPRAHVRRVNSYFIAQTVIKGSLIVFKVKVLEMEKDKTEIWLDRVCSAIKAESDWL